jgi:DNA-binding phage protein
MAKRKTSIKPKRSKKNTSTVHVAFSSPELKDVNGVIETLLECIKEGDIETFRDVLVAHLITVNKVKLAEKSGIGRRTLYDLMDPKKEFNPELSTLTAIFQALAA